MIVLDQLKDDFNAFLKNNALWIALALVGIIIIVVVLILVLGRRKKEE